MKTATAYRICYHPMFYRLQRIRLQQGFEALSLALLLPRKKTNHLLSDADRERLMLAIDQQQDLDRMPINCRCLP